MGKIRILPEHIANKIAAGEVVERPASVVKELIENALDAQSSKIDIEILDGGKKKIIVTDNGEGMDEKDIQKCFKRHGTSKITTVEDLLHIQSLGFRGEALASIVSVSKIKVRSKTQEANIGNEITVTGGKYQNLAPIGMPTGTQVIVEDLFYNIPARKKFLRTAHTESRHITEIVTNTALAFPDVGISLTHNKKAVFKFPKNQDLKERTQQLLGKTLSANLVPIFFDHPHLKISGFVAKPQISLERADRQYVFINHRNVSDRLVGGAVKQAFSTLLPQKAYPVFLLFLSLPYEMVDVNVHPRKEEIKFVNNNFVYRSIKQAVEKALNKKDLTFKPFKTSFTPDPIQHSPYKLTNVRKFVKETPITYDRKIDAYLLFDRDEFAKTEKEAEIAQFHNLYLATQTPNGILLVDQHAVHERILYEHFKNEYKKTQHKKNVQPLLVPITLDASLTEAELIKEHLTTFHKLGFEIDKFGGNSFKINSIPQILQNHDITSLITEMIVDLAEEKPPKDIDTRTQRAISFLACRSAVKAGDWLNQEKRRDILNKLKTTTTQYTCPHGRPVKIEISLRELEKMFKRR